MYNLVILGLRSLLKVNVQLHIMCQVSVESVVTENVTIFVELQNVP